MLGPSSEVDIQPTAPSATQVIQFPSLESHFVVRCSLKLKCFIQFTCLTIHSLIVFINVFFSCLQDTAQGSPMVDLTRVVEAGVSAAEAMARSDIEVQLFQHFYVVYLC